MATIDDAITADGDAVILTIDVSAGSKKERFPSGFNEWRNAVQIQIKAPAIEGRANKAIIALIASETGCKKSDIVIMSGATSTIKRVRINGCTSEGMAAFLAGRL
ncbi:hypothetical protein AZH53_04520 [Methanomicrobiaceae archaeon CYW5]|nr:hypothetical protein [Methanovulcanius yangii]